MKHLLSVLFFSVLVFSAAAQRSRSRKPHRKGLFAIANGAVGITKVTKNNFYDYGIRVGNMAYTGVGIDAGYMFSDHAGILSGVRMDMYRFKYTYTWAGPQKDKKIQQNFLTIPLMLRLVTNKQGQSSFFINTGFQLLLLAGLTDNYNDGVSHDKSGFAGSSVNFAMNFGLTIPAGRHGEVNVGPDIQYQLSNNFDLENARGRLLSVGCRLAYVATFGH